MLGRWCIVGAFGAQEEFRAGVGSLEMLHSAGVWKVRDTAPLKLTTVWTDWGHRWGLWGGHW